MKRNIIIIGGGASGMMAGITAARAGARVRILEQKEEAGKKLYATGNGHCNYTNSRMDADCYFNNQWAMRELEAFDWTRTLDYFTELGIYPVEKNGYYYPASQQASSVVNLMKAELERLGVMIITNMQVKKILPVEGGFRVEGILSQISQATDQRRNRSGKKQKPQIITNRQSFSCDRVILAAGGTASSKLGSDGSGYYLAGLLGHGLVEPLPALTGIRCREDWFSLTAGVRIQACVSLYEEGGDGKDRILLARDLGELQFTDYGISGIPAFQISRVVARALSQKKKLIISIKLLPEITDECYQAFLDQHRKNLLGLFPDKLLEVLSMDQEALKTRTLQCSPLGLNDFDKAQVTTGGIPLEEIWPGTMESRLCPGLYFAGEVMDVDGICGGYNLQWAWTSGHHAGIAASK